MTVEREFVVHVCTCICIYGGTGKLEKLGRGIFPAVLTRGLHPLIWLSTPPQPRLCSFVAMCLLMVVYLYIRVVVAINR